MRMRGAFPSPRHKIFATAPVRILTNLPAFFGIVPKQLSYWGNNKYGDCVSAEEAFAKACYSIMAGLPELFVSEANLILWARAHGYLNGANLTDVMDTMATTGLPSGSSVYTDGPYQSVDWTDQETLQSAIYQGPVKIAVAADQLENVVGTTNGWFASNFKKDGNTDHCISLPGYGSVKDLAGLLDVSVPSSIDPGAAAVLGATWSTIGIILLPSLNALMSGSGEAWLRTPTTVGQSIPTPLPPVPVPVPVPPTPAPLGYPMAGTYQCGVYSISWTAVLNDPLPLPPS